MDLLQHVDTGVSQAESEATVDARGWRMVRAARPIPRDRFSLPPQLPLAAASVGYEEAEELVLSLAQLDGAPLAVRYIGEWATVRCLIFSGHVDLVDEPLAVSSKLVEELDSENVIGGIAELRGHLAVADDDWIAASRSVRGGRVDASDGASELVPACRVVARALTAKAIAGESIKGSDLRDPWAWFRSEGITVLGWHGAVSSAVAVDRLGRRALAERLVRWATPIRPRWRDGAVEDVAAGSACTSSEASRPTTSMT